MWLTIVYVIWRNHEADSPNNLQRLVALHVSSGEYMLNNLGLWFWYGTEYIIHGHCDNDAQASKTTVHQ